MSITSDMVYDPSVAVFYWMLAVLVNGAFVIHHYSLWRRGKISTRIASKMYARLFSLAYCVTGSLLNVGMMLSPLDSTYIWQSFIRPTIPIFMVLMMLDAILDWVPGGDWLSGLEKTVKDFDRELIEIRGEPEEVDVV